MEQFPVEIIETIVRQLQFDDICNFRLCSSSLASKASQDTFKSYFLKKHVEITKPCLENFNHMTQAGSIGCVLKHLVLVGNAIDTNALETILKEKAKWEVQSNGPVFCSRQHKCSPEELADVEADLELLNERLRQQSQEAASNIEFLSKAFSNLAANSKNGKLRSLTLDVIMYRTDYKTEHRPIDGGDWKAIWQAAADTFNACVLSLAQSGLPVEKFDIFKESWRCSLGCRDMSRPNFDYGRIADSLKALKSISVSVSDHVLNDSELQADSIVRKSMVTDYGNFLGFERLFRHAPQLEELHLHWYDTYQQTLDPAHKQPGKVFERLVDVIKLPHLRSCTLRGVWVTENSLLSFLHQAPIENLTLDNVRMTSGTFHSVFDYCTSELAALKYLHFNDLWENVLVFFDEAGPKLPWMPFTNDGPMLERKASDMKLPIRYRRAEGYPLGSPQAYNWRLMRQRDFGPP